MPDFAKVQEAGRISAVEKVKTTLLEDYHNRGFIHTDVAWRNVGLYKTASDEERAVVFDMGEVRLLRNHEKTNTKWVRIACKKLKDTSVPTL